MEEPAGEVRDHVCWFPDVLPTLAELGGATVEHDVDGLSIVPTLLGADSASMSGQTVTYTFTPGNPGTYLYHSLDGANPGLHKEMGLTGMDFSKHKCPEAESILVTGIRVPIYEYMTEEYILGVAAAIRKVANYYAA